MDQSTKKQVRAYQLFEPWEVMNPREIEARFTEADWPGFSHNSVRKMMKEVHSKLKSCFEITAIVKPTNQEIEFQRMLHDVAETLGRLTDAYRMTPYFETVSFAANAALGCIAAGKEEGGFLSLGHQGAFELKRAVRCLHFKTFSIGGKNCPYCDLAAPQAGIRPYFLLLYADYELPAKKFVHTVSATHRRSKIQQSWIYSALSLHLDQLEGFDPLGDHF